MRKRRRAKKNPAGDFGFIALSGVAGVASALTVMSLDTAGATGVQYAKASARGAAAGLAVGGVAELFGKHAGLGLVSLLAGAALLGGTAYVEQLQTASQAAGTTATTTTTTTTG